MNWDNRPHRGRLLALLLGACGGPPVSVTAYLAAASWMSLSDGWGVGLVLAVAFGIAIGLTCVARLPESVAVRAGLAALYVPAVVGGLMLLWAFADQFSPGD
ncbi:hypothetical protein GobsT_69940 [Gemmata obscuriglobus]|uniref:Uncharacterized protein n=1 Tax=Gemmata obscuriglobus TaxID=114 RepID=A0A2Z3HFX5_9BACT|nr:hypothetical protein [Gemmata obscuriglobus]AWM41885.1 hypothetical protein C1280_36100 [Gemmata obscuriglobus]QEG32142.1 hypothetical protein GobsT_69940 [Gemmata obscuriglobus]VTS11495.1 unnamed protein product [Gemmata obscuriglobus UQM 2246]